MDDEPGRVPSSGHLTMSDTEWVQAQLRADVIGRLAERDRVGVAAADAAAVELGISRRQVYVLLERYRQGAGLVTDLVSRRSDGGKGGSRLSEPVEQVIRELVRTRYLTRQKRSIASLHREIARVCAVQGLPAPARNTVETRIARMNPVEVGRRREGPDSVRLLQSAGDDVPVIEGILEQVQIDHTVIDLIVVDERERQPVGRPYLTVAIDVDSRCIIGMVVTLEPPSAVSVGSCLAHAVVDKRPWLERLGVEADWPMSGKPKAARAAVPEQRRVINGISTGHHPGHQEATFDPALAPVSVGTVSCLSASVRRPALPASLTAGTRPLKMTGCADDTT